MAVFFTLHWISLVVDEWKAGQPGEASAEQAEKLELGGGDGPDVGLALLVHGDEAACRINRINKQRICCLHRHQVSIW